MARRATIAFLALIAGLVPALAQVPTTLPANTVLGRMGVGPGTPQAIPFATLFSGANVQPITSNLTALLAMGVGCAGHSGASAWTPRTITGTANQITVTNGDCTLGNPTISLPAAMTLSGIVLTGGTFNSGAFNGTLGATTPSTVLATGVGIGASPAAATPINITGSNNPSYINSHNTNSAASSGINVTNDTTGQYAASVFGSAHAGTSYGLSNAGMVSLDSAGATAMAVGTQDTAPLLLGVNNTESARFLSGGNIGFGSSSPIFDSTSARYFAFSAQNNGANIPAALGIGSNTTNTASAVLGSLAFFNTAVGAADKRIATIAVTTDGATNSGAMYFATASAGSLANRLAIDHSGNVGIGTNTPAAKLDVQGTLNVSGAAIMGAAVRFANYTCAGGGGTLTVDGSGNLACSDAATMRTLIGLGTAATQNTGTSGANVPLLNGTNTWANAQTFTAAPVFTDASGSRTALGLGTIATQAANSVAITGGALNGTTVGAATPASGKFTTLEATGAATIVAGAISGTTIGAASPATGKFTTLEATSSVKFDGMTTPGCLSNDVSGNISGGNACSGGGMPAGGSIGQAPLNSASGTALWRTEPFVNISALTGADCTGVGATVISTVIGSIKSVALPTDCTLRITGNDTIANGVFFAIPCGARIQVDGSAILTFSGETDDNECQKFSASGAGAGAGGGTVRGLRLNRPEWWGAFGDCNYGGACTHDDSGPLQQAFNSVRNANSSSAGMRPQVKFGCAKGYGVSTGIVAIASRDSPLLVDGCAPLDGGNSEGGSALYGRSGFTGIVLTVTVTGSVSTNIEIRDFKISSINDFQADTCLQIGSAGNTLSNASGHSIAHNLNLTKCKHLLKFGGSVVSFQFDRIWMLMGNNGGASGANSSCIEAVPNAETLSELTFNAIACDGAPNSDASAICLNFHAQGASGGITGTRINDVSCYQPTKGIVLNADGASLIADFWCYSCQMDSLRVNSTGYSLATTGTAHIVDVVLDKPYSTNLGAPFDLLNIDGSGGGTIDKIGVYGFYSATGGASRAIRVETASQVNIQGARIGGSYVSQGILLNNCTGCQANNGIFSGSVPVFVLLGSATDYSQACNNTASGALAPAAVSASGASGTHNIFYGSGYQTCPNN